MKTQSNQVKHTAGPWSYWPECCYENGMVTQDKTAAHIAQPINKEDGCLIAAAPDMLEALQKITEVMYAYNNAEAAFMYDLARAAIHKATGGDTQC